MTPDETQAGGQPGHDAELADAELEGVDGGTLPWTPAPDAPSNPAGGGSPGICS